MKKRGRKLGWWKIWTPQGLRDMTQAEDIATKQRGIQQRGVNAEIIAPWKDLVRSERLARLSSPASADKRQRKAKSRQNVNDRIVRIEEIAKKIHKQGWRGKFNTWIAQRLAAENKRSMNTMRADVAAAKRFLMGSQRPKN